MIGSAEMTTNDTPHIQLRNDFNTSDRGLTRLDHQAVLKSPFRHEVLEPVMATLERKKTWERMVDSDGVAVGDADGATRPTLRPPIPASVKINVEGAFIVDDETATENGAASEFVHFEHKDIRLPHHTDVVSHIAVDVSL